MSTSKRAQHPREGTCGTPTPLTDDLYEDTWVAMEGLKMLRQRPAGKPWYMQVNWPGPHGPFIVTKSMREATATREYPQPHDYTRGGLNESQLLESRQLYSAEVENLDKWMGEYLKTIEELGDTNNTIVCISSDHGELLGDHGDWAKSKPW